MSRLRTLGRGPAQFYLNLYCSADLTTMQACKLTCMYAYPPTLMLNTIQKTPFKNATIHATFALLQDTHITEHHTFSGTQNHVPHLHNHVQPRTETAPFWVNYQIPTVTASPVHKAQSTKPGAVGP
eukprot:356034-Chlamydomonas_euryale.AAC.9